MDKQLEQRFIADETNRPRWGLIQLLTDAPAAEVAEALGGALAGPQTLERLESGGVPALPRAFRAWLAEARALATERPEAAQAQREIRAEMMDAVVPPTLVYVTIGTLLALSTLAFSFLFPHLRGVFFPAAAGLLAVIMAWAWWQARLLGLRQQRLREALEEAELRLERATRAHSRPRLLARAFSLDDSPEALDAAAEAAATQGWEAPDAAPDTPLVVDGADWPAQAALLSALAKARLVLVVSPEPLEGGFERSLTL